MPRKLSSMGWISIRGEKLRWVALTRADMSPYRAWVEGAARRSASIEIGLVDPHGPLPDSVLFRSSSGCYDMHMERAMGDLAAEGLTPRTEAALRMFERAVRDGYQGRLVCLVLFGSRARGDAGPESDVDVAVVLDSIENRTSERHRLSDMGYDVIAETCVEVQGWAFSEAEWRRPELNPNPNLLRRIRVEGIVLPPKHDH